MRASSRPATSRAGDQPDRPGGGEQHAEAVATPLPPLKPSQTGNRCPSTAPSPAQQTAARPGQRGRDQDGGRPFAPSSSRVAAARLACRCAARWSRRYCPSRSADVAEPGRAGQQQAERDRAEQIAEHDEAGGGNIHPKHPPPGLPGPEHTPSSARPSNGVFCALPGSVPASTRQTRSGWNRQRSAGGALGEPPGLDPEQRGRPRGQQVDRLRQRQRAVMDLRQRHAEQRRETRAARRGLGEGQALVVGIARLVVGGDRVDRAVGQRRRPPPAGRLPCAAAATAWRRCGSRRSPFRSGRNRAARCRRSPRARPPSRGGSAPAPRRWRHGRNAPRRR